MNETDTPRCHVCSSNIVVGLCASCHLHFCEKHVSEFDGSLCSTCVSIANTIIQSKPLIDEDGVTHQGRQLVLTGETWMRNRDIISMMTDAELEAKLESMTKAVHEAEMVLDYRRIQRNQLENEKSSRLSRKLGRLRLISAVDHVHKASPTTNGKAKVDAVKDVFGALKGLGLNKDAIANVLLKLAQSKAKEKQ
jgi:hypothetical protein